MKSLTCRQLGGACDLVFQADTFEEVANASKQHGAEMFAKQDPEHLSAMAEMMSLMQDDSAMQSWMKTKQELFESQPDV